MTDYVPNSKTLPFLIGPAYQDIAAKYKTDPEARAKIEQQIHKGGSGKWGPMTMPPFPQVTRDHDFVGLDFGVEVNRSRWRQRRLSYQPRATPWVHGRRMLPKALKARLIILWTVILIPHIPLVEVHVVFAQKLEVLFLKTLGSMMFLLVIHVTHEIIELAVTDGKIAVTSLLEERIVLWALCFDPSGGGFLYLFKEVWLANRAAQSGGHVNVVGDASDAVCFASAVAANGCQIRMHSRPNSGIKPGMPVFGAKNDVDNDLA
jgi:hypothetical protein